MFNNLGYKNKNKSIKTGNDSTGEESQSEIEEMLEQLQILNISLDTILVIILAIALNYYYVYYEKLMLLDSINNTNCADYLFDASEIPKIANVMILYGTGIFLDINYSSFIKANSVQGEERDEKAILKAYRSFISSILVFLAAAVSRNNLEI